MKKMTRANLEAAFSGESQAHMKYLIFAEAAERENLLNVARLFRAIAYAEQVHATNHFRNLSGIGETGENLAKAEEGENFEVDEMYPAYDAVAKLQGEQGAQRSIHYALEAEKIHEAMYEKARQAVLAGKDPQIDELYICPVCGYTHEGTPPERCPVCNAPGSSFKKF